MTRSLQEILKGKKVADLRKEALDMMEAHPDLIFTSEGKEMTVGYVRNKSKKADLVHHISMWEQQLENIKIANDSHTGWKEPVDAVVEQSKSTKKKSTKKLDKQVSKKSVNKPVEEVVEEAVEEVVEKPSLEDKTTLPINNDIVLSEGVLLKRELASQIYNGIESKDGFVGLKEYHLRCCKSEKLFDKANYKALVLLLDRTRTTIINYANDASKNAVASPGGTNAIKVEVLKVIKEFCEVDKDSFDVVHGKSLMDSYEEFSEGLVASFSDIGREKTKLAREKRDKGELEVRTIEVFKLVEWAKNRLKNLPPLLDIDSVEGRKEAYQWKEICFALSLVSGRRSSEIMSSAIFQFVDENTLTFEGQLKRHKEAPVEGQNIPILCGLAKEVIEGISWLDHYCKRTPPQSRSFEDLKTAASISHKRCSRYLSEAMPNLIDYVVITNGLTWKDYKDANVFKPHLLRQIYAQLCSELFRPNNQKKHSYIAQILGDSRSAAQNYDRDIEVIDSEKVAELANT